SSRNSPDWVLNLRLTASPILAIAVFDAVWRISMSRVRFPIRNTLFTLPAMSSSEFAGLPVALCSGAGRVCHSARAGAAPQTGPGGPQWARRGRAAANRPRHGGSFVLCRLLIALVIARLLGLAGRGADGDGLAGLGLAG